MKQETVEQRLQQSSIDSLVQESPRSRLDLIFGKDGVDRLETSCVMVFGVGGVGSNCIESLARGRIGKLIIIDRDVVSPSNINRQAIAFEHTIGKKKVELMRDMIKAINPDCQVECVHQFIRQEDLGAFMGDYLDELDYVVDAIDTITTKLELAKLSHDLGFKLIASMGGANKLSPECLRIADLFETQNCGLCRTMRKQGRKRGITRLKVLYSCEQERPNYAPTPTRERALSLGTASFMPPIMGHMIAAHLIKDLLGLLDEDGTGCRQKACS